MALISASYTSPASGLYTRASIINAFLRRGGIGTYGTIDGSDATNTFTDKTRLANYYIPKDTMTGAWARIYYDAGGASAAPEGDIRAISDLSQGNGKLSTQYPFSAQPGSGDLYQIFRYMHPQDVLDELDNMLKEQCVLPCWTVLTEIADGDMEQSHTTDWTTTNCTIAKVTSQPTMWGARYLTVTTTSAGGYVSPSTSLKVTPGRRYHLSAIARANSSGCTPTLTAYDLSNAASISSVSTSSQSGVRIWLEFTAPSGCYSLGVRMGNAENSVVSAWDEVCLFCMDTNDLPAPWWAKDKEAIKQIVFSRWDTGESSTEWNPVPRTGPDLGRWTYMDSGFGTSQNRIVSLQGGISSPVYVFGIRNEIAYSDSNSEQKRLDFEWTVVGLQKRCFEIIQSNDLAGDANTNWVAKKLDTLSKQFRSLNYKQIQRAQDAIQAESADQAYYRVNDFATSGGYPRLVN